MRGIFGEWGLMLLFFIPIFLGFVYDIVLSVFLIVCGGLVATIGFAAMDAAGHGHPWKLLPYSAAFEVRSAGIAFAMGALITAMYKFFRQR